MAANQVEIVNQALVLLGESRIVTMADDIKPAREANAIWNQTKDALLAAHDWSFAKFSNILIDSGAPYTAGLGWANASQIMDTTFLRIVQIRDFYVGSDLSDYRGADSREYDILGRQIVHNWGAISIPVIVIMGTTIDRWHPCFARVMACQLALDLCETLTQSETKRARAEREFSKALRDAIRANAIELPSRKLPDDEWMLARR